MTRDVDDYKITIETVSGPTLDNLRPIALTAPSLEPVEFNSGNPVEFNNGEPVEFNG